MPVYYSGPGCRPHAIGPSRIHPILGNGSALQAKAAQIPHPFLRCGICSCRALVTGGSWRSTNVLLAGSSAYPVLVGCRHCQVRIENVQIRQLLSFRIVQVVHFSALQCYYFLQICLESKSTGISERGVATPGGYYLADWNSTFVLLFFGLKVSSAVRFIRIVSMATQYQYGFSFQAGPRKLLAEKEDRLPPAAPGPSAPCRDVKTGEIISCNRPHTLVMVLAGMSCMMFLVSVALILLCWAVVKQRRQRREQAANPTVSTPPQTAARQTVPVDSPEYDDAVLVQLPGDEKAQFFALPKPFLVDGEKAVDDKSKVVDSAMDGKAGCEKKAESEPPDAPPDDRPGV